MPDDLRTRIAAVIESIRIQRDGDTARMADAVIRELAWQEEFRIDIGYGGYESEPSREQALERMVEIIEDWGDDPPETGAILQTRYVTEWETDDV